MFSSIFCLQPFKSYFVVVIGDHLGLISLLKVQESRYFSYLGGIFKIKLSPKFIPPVTLKIEIFTIIVNQLLLEEIWNIKCPNDCLT